MFNNLNYFLPSVGVSLFKKNYSIKKRGRTPVERKERIYIY